MLSSPRFRSLLGVAWQVFVAFLFVELAFGFLLDGGAIHTLDKYVGIGETSGENHYHHPANEAQSASRAYRHHVSISRLLHYDLLSWATITSWHGEKRALPADNAALLAGITLGARSGFSPQFKAQMADSGTTHIVAVSGYNIGILAIAVGNIAVFFLARRFAIWIAIILILLFVGMVGSEASVVRAALMGIMALLAERVGRPETQAYAITIAAACMVLWDPEIIRNDVGFLLSFLSLLGVVYLAPMLQTLWRKADDKGVLERKANIDTTLGAQLGVLPVLLTVFGKASLTSIAANMLILPFVPFTMGVGFLLGTVNAVLPFLAFQRMGIVEQ